MTNFNFEDKQHHPYSNLIDDGYNQQSYSNLHYDGFDHPAIEMLNFSSGDSQRNSSLDTNFSSPGIFTLSVPLKLKKNQSNELINSSRKLSFNSADSLKNELIISPHNNCKRKKKKTNAIFLTEHKRKFSVDNMNKKLKTILFKFKHKQIVCLLKKEFVFSKLSQEEFIIKSDIISNKNMLNMTIGNIYKMFSPNFEELEKKTA